MDLARNLKIECVSRLQPTPARQLGPADTVGAAVLLMREHKVGCVLVCLEERMVGIFTERDLLQRILAPGKSLTTPLADCMTFSPVFVHPKDSISMAIRRMEEGGYRHLPVIVDERPVGILSVKRIVHYLTEHFASTVFNLPPASLSLPRREGA